MVHNQKAVTQISGGILLTEFHLSCDTVLEHQFLIKFIAADLCQIIPSCIKEHAVDQTLGALLGLTYSMDDFVISYFVSGASIQTLPVAIYSMTRRRVSPKINALSTIMFAVVLLVLLIYNILSSRKAKASNRSMIRAQKEEL